MMKGIQVTPASMIPIRRSGKRTGTAVSIMLTTFAIMAKGWAMQCCAIEVWNTSSWKEKVG